MMKVHLCFFFKYNSKSSRSKIILYNFEKLVDYKFSIEVVRKNLVKDFPKQIVGVKDSTYNLYENLKYQIF